MKKITLLTLALLVSVVTFAQKNSMLSLQDVMKYQRQSIPAIQGIERTSQPIGVKTIRRASGALVTPPSTATVETFYTTGGKFYLHAASGWEDNTSEMPMVKVAIDGTDMYIQGLAYWFKTAWVKGTISGETVTFANGQFVGEDEYGAEYLVGSDDGETVADMVFTYDSEDGVLSSDAFIGESDHPDSLRLYSYWSMPVFSKNVEVPVYDVVVAPEGLVTEEYSMSYTDYYKKEVSASVKVGFDNNDVYIQGFCSYLPEAWIKGTLDGTTITFAGDQYYGAYGNYELFLQEDPLVFTYDSEANTLSLTGLAYNYTGNSYADYYMNPVLTKVVEVAAVPATPEISGIKETVYGDVLMFNVPAVDVDGKGMVTSKLSYQFFIDEERVVSPLTFTTDDYSKLTEDMTVIPYRFTENYDFYSDQVYLNMDYSSWNRIGIQSIYTGGGEENKSEIFWFTIKEYSNVAFDFNAMTDEPCSANGVTDGDITEDRVLTEGDVTLTISPSTTNTPNRFWSTDKGPQLRVYGGTLTFEVPVSKVITKMVFNNGKWNNGNAADNGTFEGNIWTGEASKVVVTIAGNTQLNSIEVTTDDFVPTAVTAPEGLETVTYSFTAKALEAGEDTVEDYAAQVMVGFLDDSLFIQGLSVDDPSLWVKAVKNTEDKYVIPANQYMGTYDVGGYGWLIYDYFFTAITEDSTMVDVVLTYDEATNTISTDQTLVLNGSLTELDPYITFTGVVIKKIHEVAATPADPSVVSLVLESKYPNVVLNVPAVGTNGEVLLTSKLFYVIWIEKDGVESQLTLDAELYRNATEDMTEIPYAYDDAYDIWAAGEKVYLNQDAEELATWTKIGVQSIYRGGGEEHKSNIGWAETGANGIRNAVVDLNNGKAVIFNIAGQRVKDVRSGLYIVNGKKVVVK